MLKLIPWDAVATVFWRIRRSNMCESQAVVVLGKNQSIKLSTQTVHACINVAQHRGGQVACWHHLTVSYFGRVISKIK